MDKVLIFIGMPIGFSETKYNAEKLKDALGEQYFTFFYFNPKPKFEVFHSKDAPEMLLKDLELRVNKILENVQP